MDYGLSNLMGGTSTVELDFCVVFLAFFLAEWLKHVGTTKQTSFVESCFCLVGFVGLFVQ